MTAVLDPPSDAPCRTPAAPQPVPWRKRLSWLRYTPTQLVVMALATLAPLVIAGVSAAAIAGAISQHTFVDIALGAGENPGMVTFGAMFLASPVQWITGRSQVRVRKYLAIMFSLLALSNGALFVIETGLGAALSAPFLIAGSVALVLVMPLFATSSRWSQRTLGMKKWRLLHKLTYGVAASLLAHVVLIGDVGPGAILIALGFVARLPVVRRWLTHFGTTD